jgi:hypothetical protein
MCDLSEKLKDLDKKISKTSDFDLLKQYQTQRILLLEKIRNNESKNI